VGGGYSADAAYRGFPATGTSWSLRDANGTFREWKKHDKHREASFGFAQDRFLAVDAGFEGRGEDGEGGKGRVETGRGVGAFWSWEVWHCGQTDGAIIWLNGHENSEDMKIQRMDAGHFGADQE
jgi:hypothetical protein